MVPRRSGGYATGDSERSGRDDMANVRIGGRSIPLPASRALRIALGGALVAGGFVGFLPVLGFWMVPLGLLVLSVDLPTVRRWRRRLAVWWHRRRRNGRDDATGTAAAAAAGPDTAPKDGADGGEA